MSTAISITHKVVGLEYLPIDIFEYNLSSIFCTLIVFTLFYLFINIAHKAFSFVAAVIGLLGNPFIEKFYLINRFLAYLLIFLSSQSLSLIIINSVIHFSSWTLFSAFFATYWFLYL